MRREDERAAFLAAIEADRYDGVTRKVFADWLEEHGEDDEAVVQRQWTPEKQRAEDWLRGFAQEVDMSYEELLGATNVYLEHDQAHTLPFDTPDRALEDGKAFWQHFVTATGQSVSEEKQQYMFFRCAC